MMKRSPEGVFRNGNFVAGTALVALLALGGAACQGGNGEAAKPKEPTERSAVTPKETLTAKYAKQVSRLVRLAVDSGEFSGNYDYEYLREKRDDGSILRTIRTAGDVQQPGYHTEISYDDGDGTISFSKLQVPSDASQPLVRDELITAGQGIAIMNTLDSDRNLNTTADQRLTITSVLPEGRVEYTMAPNELGETKKAKPDYASVNSAITQVETFLFEATDELMPELPAA